MSDVHVHLVVLIIAVSFSVSCLAFFIWRLSTKIDNMTRQVIRNAAEIQRVKESVIDGKIGEIEIF